MRIIAKNLFNTIRYGLHRSTSYVHSVVFGFKNLLLTNALISASMGAAGDSIQQHYDIIMAKLKQDFSSNNFENDNLKKENDGSRYQFTRTIHLTMAGLSTGIVTHYWYLLLVRVFGSKRNPKTLIKLILLDQIIFSPINLFVYFATLAICERSEWKMFKAELSQKGFENIYIAEWLIWPPAQVINFALVPLRYRILFDNIISLGFDIYSPYVKYKTQFQDERNVFDNWLLSFYYSKFLTTESKTIN